MAHTDFDVVTGPSMAQRRSEVSQQPGQSSNNPTKPGPSSAKREDTPANGNPSSREARLT
jgi:hypothetical protein